ncbi:GNAT family N-acetyltransferase [Spirochaeta isovalerica]|uniref:GNAT superfamily N-acetyltransferase n=1 Tax=Spirochaeta isovalerica TaxID=150 RepID=A0A841R509_9SPIO|nr:GNAT family N-acetyltransferase [Spirochaeta isovalerica]MBB6478955.1 GNAT superfamily N-acetyltransferase [Spirochaeta isovalerica]
MTKTRIQDIILEDRGKFYGCDRDRFFTTGTTFNHRESLDGKKILYVTDFFDHTFITTGREIIERLKTVADKNLNDSLLPQYLPGIKKEMTYPHFLYHGSDITIPQVADGYEIIPADPADHSLLQQFLNGCTEDDIDDALIDLDDPDEEIRLVMYKGKPIGYGGYRRWGKEMGDVGILIQPDHRKKGLGRAAVAAATEACLKNDCLPFYRTSSDNTGSETIARSLGYQFEWMTTEYHLEN